METVKEVLDVREWIYELTKDEKIGTESKRSSSAYGKSNGNYDKDLSEPVEVFIGKERRLLPAGSSLTVYKKLKRRENGWAPQADAALATIFLKESGRVIEQITIRTNGKIGRKVF